MLGLNKRYGRPEGRGWVRGVKQIRMNGLPQG